jgi:hypothetical protein
LLNGQRPAPYDRLRAPQFLRKSPAKSTFCKESRGSASKISQIPLKTSARSHRRSFSIQIVFLTVVSLVVACYTTIQTKLTNPSFFNLRLVVRGMILKMIFYLISIQFEVKMIGIETLPSILHLSKNTFRSNDTASSSSKIHIPSKSQYSPSFPITILSILRP